LIYQVQLQFAQEILKLNKPTAVVLLNGGIIAIDWLQAHAPAILEAFYPGYAGSCAIASVIFGDYNPGGKLPVTIYPTDYVNQISILDMSMTTPPGRSYKYYKNTPLWPFGWGLSYTQFTLNWSLDTKPGQSISNIVKDSITYSVNVTNTGKVAGDEVAQAYFQPKDPLVSKQLFDFERIHLEPGQSVVLKFQVNFETIKFGDENGDTVSVPGAYVLEFTNGVHETLKDIVYLEGTKKILK